MHKPLLATRLGRWLALAAFGLLAAPAAQAQLVGPKAIPGDYTTLSAAITDLNAQGVGAGGVTFNIAAGYTETFASPTAGAITATGTAANPIVFQKSGTGANPVITAGVGTTTALDAIISLAGSDYVTIDGLSLTESAANTTATTQMEFGIALFRPSPTDGCQNNNIRNCVVTLNKTNTGTFGIYGAASTAASATSVAATSPAGANSNNRINGTTVSNAVSGIYLTANTSTTVANYDLNNEIGVTAGNTITNFGGVATSGWGIGVNMQNGAKIANNTVNSNGGTAGTSTLRGIYGNTGTSSNIDITNNTVTLAGGATTSSVIGIDNGIGSTAASNTVNITGNTIQNSTYSTATSGAFYAIQNTASAAVVNLNNNTITGNASSATSGSFMALRNTASASTLNINNNIVTNNILAGSGEYDVVFNSGTPSTAMAVNGNQFSSTAPIATSGALNFLLSDVSNSGTMSIQNNTFGNFTKSGTGGTVYGYYNNSSPSATQTISGNTFSGITLSGASPFYGTFINTSSSQVQTVTNNTVSNVTGGTSAVYGLYVAYGAATSTINNNTVTGLTSAGATYGLWLGSSLSGGTIFSNNISNLTTTGAATVYGIYTSATNPVIYRNKIYNLAGSAAGGQANGLYVNSGTTITLHNNLVGDLRAPAATGLNAVVGLFVAGGTTVNAYYNTIYLAATSSGATFGTSGIYLGSSSTSLDARNNIVVNRSTAAGTGGYTAALRRTPGTAGTVPTNLATTTNNNLYYAGTPSATNLIYVEGTTATTTNAQQTLAAYKAFLLNREANSVTETATPFASITGSDATFLHLTPGAATQAESAGQPLNSIAIDYDGDARSATTPDIGADEGSFQLLDQTGPTISITGITGSLGSLVSRTLTASITDVSGIATGTGAPRLYFRKGTGAYVAAAAPTVSGSTYTFTFDYSLLGGVVAGDAITYYIAAQDALGNLSTNPTGGTGTTPPGTTAPGVAYGFTIVGTLNGTYYVSANAATSPAPTRTYATLTAAAAAYSTNAISGPVTFLLLDNAYSAATGETFPVTFFNNADASATNTLLIKPNTGVTPVVTAAGSVLILASTRYVTIDGSNTANGTTRDLTLTNTSLTASTYGLGLLSQVGQAQSNLFTTVRNVNVVGGGATANATIGIVLGGADNDNVTLQNNSVVGVTTGIQAIGSANTSVGGLDNLVITGNVVGPATAAAGANINQYGIVVASALSPVVSRNEVQNIVNPTATFSSNMTGILLQDVQTGIVTRNTVHNLVYNGTSTAKLYGISTQISTSAFNTAATPSAIRFDNNLVYALNSTATSSSWNTSGINNNGGYGDQYYYNTVYLNGQLSTGTAGSAAFSNGNGIVSTAAANVDVRNNIFSIIGGTGTTTTPLYAHYTTLANYTGSTLNNNDLFVTVAGTAGVARIGRINSADATTLADWRTATSQEAGSVSVNPNFTQATTAPLDLTPTAPALNNVAAPIASVTVDYTGAVRGTTPDIGAYEFTPSPVDITPTALVGPASSGCYGATESVIVTLTNNATAALNFALNPSTITVTVTKPDNTTQAFTTSLTTGTLAPNATQNITLPGTLNMSAAGTYSFAIATVTTGDGNTGNDNLTVTRTVVGFAAQPQLVTFTGFTGANLSTVFPGWSEATGAALPAGTTSAWTSTTFPANNTTAKVNLYSTGKNEWIVSPKFLATNSTRLSFDAGITDYASTTADPDGMTGTDDFVEVRISTDCGQTFARIPAFAQFNAGNQPSNGSLTNYSIDLSSYAGQQIIIGFFASEGTVDDTPDYDFHLDNLAVSSPLPIDLTPVALLTPTATQGCYSAAETVTVSVRNLGTLPLDFSVNPATVTAVVTTPSGPQNLTATVSTGTLAPNALQTVTLTPTLDMSAVGAYSFAITATVTGDQVTSNDVLAAVTRTVAAPVAGTVTPGSSSLCISGTATLTLTGAANGSIQWQQSTDNTAFTDISGATAATYTTPVLNSTTYFRAQVRCATQATATSNVSTITVNNPLVASSSPAQTICSGATATLTATASAGASIRFFSAATGGTALATTTPGSYTTPALTANTTYYAAAFTGSQENVGPTTQTSTGLTPQTGGALYFTTTQALTISAVTVYLNAGQAAGTVTIALRTGSSTTGAVVNSQNVAFAVPAGPATGTAAYVVPLNYSVPAAGQYTLHLSSATQSGLLRDDAGANTTGYPYNAASGLLSITGASVSGYYYYFYNWQLSTECSSATRTPIQVNVTPVATASFPAATAATCGTSPYTLAGTVGGSATSGTYTSSGTGTFSPNATTPTATYTPSAADVAAGSVTITLTTTGPCAAVTATQTLSISPAPVATLSYPTATTYCAGSASTVTPALGTGATAGTFSSTTGLTIDPATGVITLATSTAGTYTVTNTIAASGACAAATATTTVTITPAASATFAYSGATFCQSGTNPTATVTGNAGGTFTSTTGLSINATTGAINLSASTLGTYTVTYTVAGACGATATASVTITAAPVATFSYANASACAGSATLLTPSLGTGATAGTFTSTTGLTINATTGAVNPATSTAGTYTVTNTVAASGGCAAATSTATVTINALPATPTYTYTYPTRSTVLFTSSVAPAGTTYQWYLTTGTPATTTAITGATSQTYTANGTTTPGIYTVRFINTATGCQSAASVPLTVTATGQPLAGSSLTLFPNPTADGKLTLQLSGYPKAVQLTVIDALGRVVLTQKVAAGQTQAQLDLSGSASGVYTLRATTEGGTDIRRIVRE